MNRTNTRLGNVLRSLFVVADPTTKNEEPITKNALCASFSLIEVCLAMMVISVGILAVLGLFPVGLDQNSRSIADSHVALFADEVMSGLRACADEDWSGLTTNISLPPAAAAQFPDVSPTKFRGTNVWTNVYANGLGVVNHALRYRLELMSNGNRKAAMLSVWGSQFGGTSPPSIFYTEFFRYKPQ